MRQIFLNETVPLGSVQNYAKLYSMILKSNHTGHNKKLGKWHCAVGKAFRWGLCHAVGMTSCYLGRERSNAWTCLDSLLGEHPTNNATTDRHVNLLSGKLNDKPSKAQIILVANTYIHSL